MPMEKTKSFIIDDYKGKRTWMDELFLITDLPFVSNVALTKVHIYVIKGMNA
jgi:hypothetical protein